MKNENKRNKAIQKMCGKSTWPQCFRIQKSVAKFTIAKLMQVKGWNLVYPHIFNREIEQRYFQGHTMNSIASFFITGLPDYKLFQFTSIKTMTETSKLVKLIILDREIDCRYFQNPKTNRVARFFISGLPDIHFSIFP